MRCLRAGIGLPSAALRNRWNRRFIHKFTNLLWAESHITRAQPNPPFREHLRISCWGFDRFTISSRSIEASLSRNLHPVPPEITFLLRTTLRPSTTFIIFTTPALMAPDRRLRSWGKRISRYRTSARFASFLDYRRATPR